jgi:hypothetical protein
MVDEVHVSVTFTWDLLLARKMEEAWSAIHPCVRIGGPAEGSPPGEFAPGRYLRRGFVITTRGCPKRCYFCFVPRREGPLRTLPITEGWNVVDNNLLAAPTDHIRAVFDMLRQQPERIVFSGGLDADYFHRWHIPLLRSIRLDRLYMAYDRLKQLPELQRAGRLLRDAGYTDHHLYAYVLCGWEDDTVESAEKRMREVYTAGFVPFAMLYRNDTGKEPPEVWRRFQRIYARPAVTRTVLRGMRR